MKKKQNNSHSIYVLLYFKFYIQIALRSVINVFKPIIWKFTFL